MGRTQPNKNSTNVRFDMKMTLHPHHPTRATYHETHCVVVVVNLPSDQQDLQQPLPWLWIRSGKTLEEAGGVPGVQ